MEVENLRPRPKTINTSRQSQGRRNYDRTRYNNRRSTSQRYNDEDDSIDNRTLFIYQSMVSVVIIAVVIFANIINTSFSNDLVQKLKYALVKQTHIDEIVNSAQNKIDNLPSGVLEIFGFKGEENSNEELTDESSESNENINSDIDVDFDEYSNEYNSQLEDSDALDDIELSETNVLDDISSQTNEIDFSEEEKKSSAIPEIIVFPED